jgi:hypothetical protein
VNYNIALFQEFLSIHILTSQQLQLAGSILLLRGLGNNPTGKQSNHVVNLFFSVPETVSLLNSNRNLLYPNWIINFIRFQQVFTFPNPPSYIYIYILQLKEML